MTNNYQLPILMYHRVVKKRNDSGIHNIFILERKLRRQFNYLKKNNFNTITFRDLPKLKPEQKQKNVILTFDDGYADNYSLLFPLLKEYGFTAVVFLVTREKINTWGIKEGEPCIPLLTEVQIKEMDAYGIEFGAHTCTHPHLFELSGEEAKYEITDCKKDLEVLLGKPVISFAYPFGEVNEGFKKTVADTGYRYALATFSGPYAMEEDLLQIRRIEVPSQTLLVTFKRKVGGYYFKPSILNHIPIPNRFKGYF